MTERCATSVFSTGFPTVKAYTVQLTRFPHANVQFLRLLRRDFAQQYACVFTRDTVPDGKLGAEASGSKRSLQTHKKLRQLTLYHRFLILNQINILHYMYCSHMGLTQHS